MAEIEKVSEADRLEQANLERVVADVERTLLGSPPGTRPFFNGFLVNAKARLGVLDKKIHDEEREKEQQKSNEVAIVQLAEKESALNSKEKEEYSGFLKEDFFTKKDFARLDDFYAHAWDRLSERGKVEMSHRIWEGVRRDEYKFTDLPKDVQGKEAKRAYTLLHDSKIQTDSASRIPEKDSSDFIQAYEGGKMEDASKVLDRESFKASMFRQADSTPIRHAARNVETGTEDAAILASVKPAPPKDTASAKSAEAVNISSIELNGMALADSASQGAIANLPRTQGGASRGC